MNQGSSWGLNPGPADNGFRLSAHCANEPQRLGHVRDAVYDEIGYSSECNLDTIQLI